MTHGAAHTELPINDGGSVNWRSVAVPQADQSDALAVLELARAGGYRRRLVESPAFLDGAVALREDPGTCDLGCIPASPSHPHIAIGEAVLRQWQIGFEQCQILLDTVSPIEGIGPLAGLTGLGAQNQVAISGAGSRGFGSVISAINSPSGFAQGIVHEMAHHKLHTLGVHLESSDRLVTNPPWELFQSPIRYDRLRPMQAVLHAQYSYSYVAALSIEAVKEPDANTDAVEGALALLRVLIPKLRFGQGIILGGARVDDIGRQFVEGYIAWLELLLTEGSELLARAGVPPQEFIHPLPGPADPVWLEAPRDPRAEARPNPGNDISQEWDGASLRLSGQGHEPVLLNQSAAEIWGLCDGTRSVWEISRQIEESIGATPGALFHHVARCVDALSWALA